MKDSEVAPVQEEIKKQKPQKEKLYEQFDEKYIPSVNQDIESSFKKVLITAIEMLQKKNDLFKFMGIPNLLDFILAQNQSLKHHFFISIEDFLKNDFENVKQELKFLDKFYKTAYGIVSKSKTIPEDLYDQTDFTLRTKSSQKQQIQEQSILLKDLKLLYEADSKKFTDYKKESELTFVHIYDPDQKIEILNTKIFAQQEELGNKSSGMLVLRFINEFTRYFLANWENICFIFIILYFTQNSGFLGCILPAIMFLWILIEDYDTPRYFWIITYIIYSLTILIIFFFSMNGINYQIPGTEDLEVEQKPWFYPLYDSSNYELFFEIFILWLVISQVYVQKKFGLYYTSKNQIENLFQAYIRLKINNFNKEILQENEEEEQQQLENAEKIYKSEIIDSEIEEGKMDEKQLQDQLELKKQKESAMQEAIQKQEEEYQIQQKQQNSIEQRILQDPNLLKSNTQYNFFVRTFSYKFSRPGVDLYTPIAITQLILFIYLLFFFSAMTDDGVNFNNILKYNQIPGTLVLALLSHLILMIVERYITMFQNVQTQKKEEEKKKESEGEQQPSWFQRVFCCKKQQAQPQPAAVELTQKEEEDQPKINEEEEKKKEQNEDKKKEQESFFQIYKLQFLMKFVLQIVLVILVYWFVFIHIGQPGVKKTFQDPTTLESETVNFSSNTAVVIFFLIYSVYFFLSALQLKYGYRELKMRNTFLQSYSTVSYAFVKTYYAIPFLFELKVLMDWTFLQTSLDVFQWFILEDIHGLMFFAKNQAIKYLDRKVGQKIVPIQKCGLGCTLVLFILICIFGPLVLFSTLNPSTQLNLVNGGSFTINLVNLDTGLSVELYNTNQLYGLETQLQTQTEIDNAFNATVTNTIINQAPETGALQQFQLLSYSDKNWDISEPLYQQLLSSLESRIMNTTNQRFLLNVTFYLTRQEEKTIPQQNRFHYPGNSLLQGYYGQENTSLSYDYLVAIYRSINNCSKEIIPLPNFYVETIQLYSSDGGATFKSTPILGQGVQSVENVTMSLQCSSQTTPIDTQSWWSFTYSGNSVSINQEGSQGLLFFVVSDKYSSLTSGFSIITIYTSVILLIGTFIRSLFSGQVYLLEFNGMLRPDDLLMICEAISIARTQNQLVKENLLYFELIDILRSPEIVKIMTGSWSETYKRKYQLEKEKED